MKAIVTHSIAFAVGALVTLFGLAYMALSAPDAPVVQPASIHSSPRAV